jgi:hypothetical protein
MPIRLIFQRSKLSITLTVFMFAFGAASASWAAPTDAELRTLAGETVAKLGELASQGKVSYLVAAGLPYQHSWVWGSEGDAKLLREQRHQLSQLSILGFEQKKPGRDGRISQRYRALSASERQQIEREIKNAEQLMTRIRANQAQHLAQMPPHILSLHLRELALDIGQLRMDGKEYKGRHIRYWGT